MFARLFLLVCLFGWVVDCLFFACLFVFVLSFAFRSLPFRSLISFPFINSFIFSFLSFFCIFPFSVCLSVCPSVRPLRVCLFIWLVVCFSPFLSLPFLSFSGLSFPSLDSDHKMLVAKKHIFRLAIRKKQTADATPKYRAPTANQLAAATAFDRRCSGATPNLDAHTEPKYGRHPQ